MKTRKADYWKVMFQLFALSGSLLASGTVLGGQGVGLGVTPELTARWWQWVYSIPSSVHPLSQKDVDETGADYCMVGQQGGTWYLGGVFKIVDASTASNQTSADDNGDVVNIVRECEDIPLGKTILIPVLNAACDTAGELAFGNAVPDDSLEKIRYLRNCAKTLADAVDKNTASASFGPYNGTLRPVQVRRVHTTLPFSVTYSPDNIFSSGCSDGGEPFLCDPVEPSPSLTQADGYWAHVRPQRPGKYKLQTFGEAPDFGFALAITYTVTVVGPEDQ
jgi:hypothetical protein